MEWKSPRQQAYHYDLDEIEHDPYVLISAISALHGGEWTIDEVGGTIQMLFDKQYRADIRMRWMRL